MSQHDEERAMERLYAARAEGPAPVSAPLDREGVARIIDPDGFARREQHLRVSAEWHEKAEKFAATENPAPYPDGRFAVERIVEAWRGVAEKHATYAETDVRHAYAKADAILALSQQVGLTTPAVLGEPSADALRSGGDDAVGAAERDVGRYIYQRIEALMDAKHVTGIANELTYLATIAEAVEEYGSEARGGEDLSVFQGPPPPAGGVK